MPELAEVEVVRRNLEKWWLGRPAREVRLLDSKSLKQGSLRELEAAFLTPLEALSRRGKYLTAHFESGDAVVFHFRMTGKIVLSETPEPRFARLAWLIDGVGWGVFKDQRRFGEVHLLGPGGLAAYEPLMKMGPEPEDLTLEELRAKISDRKMLKSALLDQAVVAGVGNIAVSELFWRCGIAPESRGGDLSEAQWEALVVEMPRYFDEVIERSMADEIDYIGEAGGGENIFDVYGHQGEPCPRCGEPIALSRVAGRSSYFCPPCQGGGQPEEATA